MYGICIRLVNWDLMKLTRLWFIFVLFIDISRASDLEINRTAVVNPPRTSSGLEDIQGYKAISELHKQLDDDRDGQVDISESDDFLREELQYENGQERHKIFHRQKKQLTVDDLWEAWKKSEVHNWTVQETVDWLVTIVDLPQYADAFTDNEVDGSTLPRLASNSYFLSHTLGIKDPIHKRKISVKAMDVVLFGPPKGRNVVKDAILWGLLITIVAGSWVGYVQHTRSQRQLQEMNRHLEGLQKAEDELKLLQAQLSQAKQQTDDGSVVPGDDTNDSDLRRAYKRSSSESKSLGGNVDTLQTLRDELRIMKEQLMLARQQQDAKRWMPPFMLQLLLQLTYEIEWKHFNNRKTSAERELEAAKDGCDKLRRKKTSLLASFQLTRDNAIYDIDGRILRAKSQLNELTEDLRERSSRWKKVEELCGFSIIKNPGLVSLRNCLSNFQQDNLMHLPTSLAYNGGLDMLEDDFENFDSHIGATALFSGEPSARPSPPRKPLYHHDSGNSLHSSNTSTPSEKISSALSSTPMIGSSSLSGAVQLDASRSNSEDSINSAEVLGATMVGPNVINPGVPHQELPYHLPASLLSSAIKTSQSLATADITDQDRVSLPPDMVATAIKSSSIVNTVDVATHHPTFIVGESSFDTSPESESARDLSAMSHVSHGHPGQQVKSLVGDTTDSSKDGIAVAAALPTSASECPLRSSSQSLQTGLQSSSSSRTLSSVILRKSRPASQVAEIPSGELKTLNPSVGSNEELPKKPPKKKKNGIFSFRRQTKSLQN